MCTGARNKWELPVSSAQFCCEAETPLKNQTYLNFYLLIALLFFLNLKVVAM